LSIKKNNDDEKTNLQKVGAESRTRTDTDIRPRDFKSLASTISPSRHGCLEAAPGFEPGVKVLQTTALPLGYAAVLFSTDLPKSV
jgi:hypothetical protein